MRLMGPMILRVLSPTSLGLNLVFSKDRSSDHFSLFYSCAALVTLFGNINFHIYADDIQLYMAFDPRIDGAVELALSKLSSRITDIHEWMARNMLMLNNSKTECVVAASPQNLAKLHNNSYQTGDNKISPLSKIKNLGVIFDETMSMKDHVNTIVKTVNFHLRKIYRIRRFITVDSCNQFARSLILSRLDYANSLSYGIAAKDRRKLQKLQNKAVKAADFILLRPAVRASLVTNKWESHLQSAAFDLQGCEQSHSYLPVWLSHQVCLRERKSAL